MLEFFYKARSVPYRDHQSVSIKPLGPLDFFTHSIKKSAAFATSIGWFPVSIIPPNPEVDHFPFLCYAIEEFNYKLCDSFTAFIPFYQQSDKGERGTSCFRCYKRLGFL